MKRDLDDDFWEDLLTRIEDGKVIPVVGAGVVTRGDDQSHFYPWLARRLAERLGVPVERLPSDFDLNDVATAHLLNRGDANLYNRVFQILRDECPAPGRALLDLAGISAFGLYLTTTFDPLLRDALDLVRHDGKRLTTVYTFAPRSENRDLPTRKKDLQGTNVFHLLGRVSTGPEYVVWEEDMLEFILALNDEKRVPERLGRELKESGLLFLGLNFSDWLVRFFLRVSKQERLSTLRMHPAYVTESPGNFSPQSLVLFFEAVSQYIHVMRQDPIAFCAELARRWQVRNPPRTPDAKPVLPPVAAKAPRGAVFISYAREDETAAAILVGELLEAGCVVWYDRERLELGQDWQHQLEDAVKKRCGLFLSIISRTTEGTQESGYHLERNWAAARVEWMAHDAEFYLPVVIDDTPLPPTREPRAFHKLQATWLVGGRDKDGKFAKCVLALQRKAMDAIK